MMNHTVRDENVSHSVREREAEVVRHDAAASVPVHREPERDSAAVDADATESAFDEKPEHPSRPTTNI
jgi:hypothetical protein